jgi:hypothetical protein
MAEILVSDQYANAARRRSSAVFLLPQGARSAGALFLGSFPTVFLVVFHCFVSIAFFLAITRLYIVFLRIFAL